MPAALLHDAVRTGDFSAVPLAEDVVLRSSSPAGLVRVAGAEAVRDHLSRPGPGEVPLWDAREFPAGAAVTFEWRGTTHDRRRWYVRMDGGAITGWWSYSARPRATAAEAVPARVLEALGAADGGALEHGGNSGAALQRATIGGAPVVLKRCAPGADWLGRVTRDEGRTGLLWRAGALQAAAQDVETGIVGVVEDDGASWVAMRDVSAHLLGDERRLSRDEARRVLAAGAALHRRFRGAPPPGCATLEARLGMSSPRVAEAERDGPDLLPKQLELAWEAFADACPPDVAEPVLAWARDPAPLAERLLAAAPATLLHGDLRDDNLGFDGERVVLLDWDLATAGTPSVELAWFLLHDVWRTDATHDELEADFLALEDDVDPVEHELGMASGLVQYGWVLGHSALVHPDPAETAWAREELGWWVPRVRRALEAAG
jgi:hypothetical protein